VTAGNQIPAWYLFSSDGRSCTSIGLSKPVRRNQGLAIGRLTEISNSRIHPPMRLKYIGLDNVSHGEIYRCLWFQAARVIYSRVSEICWIALEILPRRAKSATKILEIKTDGNSNGMDSGDGEYEMNEHYDQHC